MKKQNDGGPAFPSHEAHPDSDPRNRISGGGMSLRDWYAGMAIQGLMANTFIQKEVVKKLSASGVEDANQWNSRVAFNIADAMIEARNAERD